VIASLLALALSSAAAAVVLSRSGRLAFRVATVGTLAASAPRAARHPRAAASPYLPGCPPHPFPLLAGLVRLLGRM